jgi:hypothetical protein
MNSVSIPCLAGMGATGAAAGAVTNLFGGSISNEGLGLFSLSFDPGNINNMEMPLKYLVSSAIKACLTADQQLDWSFDLCRRLGRYLLW